MVGGEGSSLGDIWAVVYRMMGDPRLGCVSMREEQLGFCIRLIEYARTYQTRRHCNSRVLEVAKGA